MRVIQCENYDKMSSTAADFVAAQILFKPDSVLGLATGSTPLGMYGILSDMCKNGKADFSSVRTFNLDEYYPIAPDSEQSYHHFMYENLFSKINIKDENIHLLNGLSHDIEQECRRYEENIENCGGIDLQILGIGENGHIGFNEPGNFLYSKTHLTSLTESTVAANSRFFDSMEEVPKQAITMGMSSIFKAKSILLLASGEKKNEVVNCLLKEKIDTGVPATLLCMHPNVTLICDEAACSKKIN